MRLTRWMVILATMIALPAPAGAAGSDLPDGSNLALLIGLPAAGIVQGGVSLNLKPGWKTYWRNPGDAGIAPVIDVSRSTNIAALDLDFPAPTRFGEKGLWSAGYSGKVVLPFRARLVDPARPAQIVMKVLVGVCREICIPVEQELRAQVGATATRGIDPAAIADLARARAAVPKPVVANDPLAVLSASREADGIIMTVRLPVDGKPIDLFVDGPDTLEVGMTERLDDRDGAARWRVPMRLEATGTNTSVRATIVGLGRAAEQQVALPSTSP